MRRTALVGLLLLAASSQAITFRVTSPLLNKPFSGRVVIYASKSGGEPRFGPNWFRPEPMLGVQVRNLKPGEAVIVNPAQAITFPKDFSKAENGAYNIQAVFDLNLGSRTIGRGEGNIRSEVQKVEIDWKSNEQVSIVCDQVIPARTFRNTDSVKEARIESKLLTKFFGRSTPIMAAVVLPEGYGDDPNRKYPVIYSVPGFGGSHYNLSGSNGRSGTLRDGESFIFVSLNPECWTGHNVFADSANNGPWGAALTKELIPYIEKTYRAVGRPEGRFVTGHSSGGWSSFWLQYAYPDFFGGCWSTSPDPVDFRDFQGINLYRAGENMFRDPEGNPRPLARNRGVVSILYESFSDMERPLRGEQLGSFEGVFSARGRDGEPAILWNRITGEISKSVAESWRKYDISYNLRTRAKQLVPKLKGKIHVYTGNEDTFYLEGAVKLLKADLEAMGNPYKALIEIFPGDHGSVMTPQLRQRIDSEMAQAWRAAKAKFGPAKGV